MTTTATSRSWQVGAGVLVEGEGGGLVQVEQVEQVVVLHVSCM
jgi:hypothetical protein